MMRAPERVSHRVHAEAVNRAEQELLLLSVALMCFVQ